MALTKVNTDLLEDGGKLDGIEAGADVTDTTNVTAAGALMDSELTSEASVKALNQGVATGDSPTFAGLNASGNLTLDVAGDIILDSDGGLIEFKNGGTRFGRFTHANSNLELQSMENSGDILLRGKDSGGNNVTALTLDMSAAGAATFVSTVTAQKLVSTNGVLELDDNGSHNGVINSPASLFINIDSDNGSTGEDFVIGKDRTSTSGGTELFRVQEDGNAGIGTDSPVSFGANTHGLTINGTGNYQHLTLQNNGNSDFSIFTNGSSGTIINQESADPLLFNTSGTERMRINSNGTIAVNSTATNRELTIAAVLSNGQCDLALRASDDNNYCQLLFGDTSQDNQGIVGYKNGDEFMFFNTNGGERMRIDSSGNVGIGVSNPSDYYTNFNDLVLGNTSTHSGMTIASGTIHDGTIAFADGTSGTAEYSGYIQYNHGTDSLMVGTSGAERMRMDSAGRLLVGKTSADDSVVGLKVSSLGVITSSIASPSTNTYLMYQAGYKFYVTSNGGISNVSANNVNLSDEREKKNIELLESQWNSLKQWSLKKFHYNADADSDNKKLGVIAQEVETHNPEVIDEFNVDDETTRMAVKEQQMMWMAIKTLQEAQTRIETLEARVTELENN